MGTLSSNGNPINSPRADLEAFFLGESEGIVDGGVDFALEGEESSEHAESDYTGGRNSFTLPLDTYSQSNSFSADDLSSQLVGVIVKASHSPLPSDQHTKAVALFMTGSSTSALESRFSPIPSIITSLTCSEFENKGAELDAPLPPMSLPTSSPIRLTHSFSLIRGLSESPSQAEYEGSKRSSRQLVDRDVVLHSSSNSAALLATGAAAATLISRAIGLIVHSDNRTARGGHGDAIQVASGGAGDARDSDKGAGYIKAHAGYGEQGAPLPSTTSIGSGFGPPFEKGDTSRPHTMGSNELSVVEEMGHVPERIADSIRKSLRGADVDGGSDRKDMRECLTNQAFRTTFGTPDAETTRLSDSHFSPGSGSRSGGMPATLECGEIRSEADDEDDEDSPILPLTPTTPTSILEAIPDYFPYSGAAFLDFSVNSFDEDASEVDHFISKTLPARPKPWDKPHTESLSGRPSQVDEIECSDESSGCEAQVSTSAFEEDVDYVAHNGDGVGEDGDEATGSEGEDTDDSNEDSDDGMGSEYDVERHTSAPPYRPIFEDLVDQLSITVLEPRDGLLRFYPLVPEYLELLQGEDGGEETREDMKGNLSVEEIGFYEEDRETDDEAEEENDDPLDRNEKAHPPIRASVSTPSFPSTSPSKLIPVVTSRYQKLPQVSDLIVSSGSYRSFVSKSKNKSLVRNDGGRDGRGATSSRLPPPPVKKHKGGMHRDANNNMVLRRGTNYVSLAKVTVNHPPPASSARQPYRHKHSKSLSALNPSAASFTSSIIPSLKTPMSSGSDDIGSAKGYKGKNFDPDYYEKIQWRKQASDPISGLIVKVVPEEGGWQYVGNWDELWSGHGVEEENGTAKAGSSNDDGDCSSLEGVIVNRRTNEVHHNGTLLNLIPAEKRIKDGKQPTRNVPSYPDLDEDRQLRVHRMFKYPTLRSPPPSIPHQQRIDQLKKLPHPTDSDNPLDVFWNPKPSQADEVGLQRLLLNVARASPWMVWHRLRRPERIVWEHEGILGACPVPPGFTPLREFGEMYRPRREAYESISRVSLGRQLGWQSRLWRVFGEQSRGARILADLVRDGERKGKKLIVGTRGVGLVERSQVLTAGTPFDEVEPRGVSSSILLPRLPSKTPTPRRNRSRTFNSPTPNFQRWELASQTRQRSRTVSHPPSSSSTSSNPLILLPADIVVFAPFTSETKPTCEHRIYATRQDELLWNTPGVSWQETWGEEAVLPTNMLRIVKPFLG